MTFGATVRQLRVERKIGLRKFAAMVGMSPTYLSKVERDTLPPPTTDKIKRIASALDHDFEHLCALAAGVSKNIWSLCAGWVSTAAIICVHHGVSRATFLSMCGTLYDDVRQQWMR